MAKNIAGGGGGGTEKNRRGGAGGRGVLALEKATPEVGGGVVLDKVSGSCWRRLGFIFIVVGVCGTAEANLFLGTPILRHSFKRS